MFKLLFIVCLLFMVSCTRTVGTIDRTARTSVHGLTTNQTTKALDEEENEEKKDGKLSLNVEIIRIVVGDTAEFLYGELSIMLRLEHIDAPEKRGSQAYGKKATKVLTDLCYGQEVSIMEFDNWG